MVAKNSVKSALVWISLALSIASNAFADEVDVCPRLTAMGIPIIRISNFDQFSTQIVHQLEDECVEKVGDLKLAKLEKQMSEVQGFMLVGGYMAAGPDGERQTGNCDPDHKRVVVSCYSWMYGEPEARKMLGMHEGLCAAGYNDEDFQLSTSLWLLAKQKELGAAPPAPVSTIPNVPKTTAGTAQELPFFKDIPKLKRTPTYPIMINGKPGGSTGVGGGGDQRIATVKMDILSKAMQKFGQLTHQNQDAFVRIINTKIEFSMKENGEHPTLTTGRTQDGRPAFVIGWNRNLDADDEERIANQILQAVTGK